MKRENLFYLILIVTILIIRISIIIVPEVDIKFLDIVIHHFWFGVILMIIGVIVPKQKVYPKILLYGIGAGLIVDQLIFMILGAGKDKEYWALPSLLGTIIIVLVIYPIRTKVTNFLLKGTKIN
jgi:peptidoglycan/LPS O-acetylase OafA/YrhL|tara:strand:+ start:143 stop:514 length:372 start_codon:yes stop_codon:yes gene_type:complete